MKNSKTFRILSVLLVLMMTAIMVQAQTSEESKAKAEYEKQMKEKDMQMKQMEMQLKKQQLEQEKKMAELEKVHERQARTSTRSSTGSRERSFVYTMPEHADEGAYVIHSFGQENQSQLTLRNSFDGVSNTSSGNFEVDENTHKFRCTNNGKVRHGEITIKVNYPNGKVFKNLTINSSAQVSFSQSITIKEEERKKFVGSWSYEVKADKAEGSYALSIMSN